MFRTLHLEICDLRGFTRGAVIYIKQRYKRATKGKRPTI
nr:MAG TPA: hypothetical protein [Caudoviricetes sp.]